MNNPIIAPVIQKLINIGVILRPTAIMRKTVDGFGIFRKDECLLQFPREFPDVSWPCSGVIIHPSTNFVNSAGMLHIEDVASFPTEIIDNIIMDMLKNAHEKGTVEEVYRQAKSWHSSFMKDATKHGNMDVIEWCMPYMHDEFAEILLIASEFGLTKIVERLVARINDVNVRNKRGFTALHLAASNGHTDIVGILLPHIDFSLRNDNEDTPLHLTTRDEIAKLLLPHIDVDVRNSAQETPLHYAVSAGNTKLAEILIDNQCDVNATNNVGETPLFYTSDVAMVNLLLSHGGNPNHSTNDGDYPLLDACSWGRSDVVKALLNHGANPRFVDADSQDALFWIDIAEEAYGYGDDEIDAEGSRKIVEEFMDDVWDDGVPSLMWLCIFHMRRSRSRIDEQVFVDTIPDALVREQFSDWKGANRWI